MLRWFLYNSTPLSSYHLYPVLVQCIDRLLRNFEPILTVCCSVGYTMIYCFIVLSQLKLKLQVHYFVHFPCRVVDQLCQVNLKGQEVMDMAVEVRNVLAEHLSHPRGYPPHLIR